MCCVVTIQLRLHHQLFVHSTIKSMLLLLIIFLLKKYVTNCIRSICWRKIQNFQKNPNFQSQKFSTQKAKWYHISKYLNLISEGTPCYLLKVCSQYYRQMINVTLSFYSFNRIISFQLRLPKFHEAFLQTILPFFLIMVKNISCKSAKHAEEFHLNNEIRIKMIRDIHD